jgi:hypothetical protein
MQPQLQQGTQQQQLALRLALQQQNMPHLLRLWRMA